jgi:hypothetical protein
MSFSSPWEVRRWYDPLSEETETRQCATREWAYRWLLGFRGDAFRMREFRRLLASANYRSLDRCDDDEVLKLLGSEIGSGRFLLVRSKPLLLAVAGGESEAAPAPGAAVTRPAPRPPSPAPVFDEPTLPETADPIAIAAVMREAATLGLPFCEECARQARTNLRP